jgi:drug/metabolite transporter superfamily protein YnfA
MDLRPPDRTPAATEATTEGEEHVATSEDAVSSVRSPRIEPIEPKIDEVAIEEEQAIEWTTQRVLWTLFVFLFSGIFEIGGGWLIWQGVRGDTDGHKKPWYWILIGCIVIMTYGFIPTLQPEGADFSRVYAVYGGAFIGLSYMWGEVTEGGMHIDMGDWIGIVMSFTGVMVAWFWPRKKRVV